MAMNPPQQMDALWYFARAATSKSCERAAIQDKLRLTCGSCSANYQGGNVCDNLTDAELNELLQLAGSSADRPASYKLASSADLDGGPKDMTIASVVTDLKAGGDKGKLTWPASCGLEFPEVPGKLIEIAPGPTADRA